ncbi:multiple epidermal growth factor-like domains protein 9 [Tiliqua scincoides]|uniref:multiple epidermal growth factor-like domains protein 9 n=1 Tax=Tiliqua scincoides TaxID=71010 RepID=UPI003462A3FB
MRTAAGCLALLLLLLPLAALARALDPEQPWNATGGAAGGDRGAPTAAPTRGGGEGSSPASPSPEEAERRNELGSWETTHAPPAPSGRGAPRPTHGSPAPTPPREEEEEEDAPSGTGSFCNCSSVGSTGDCSATPGQCECHEGYAGPLCDECEAGYYPEQSGGRCLACGCDSEGSLSPVCNNSGICQCKAGATGSKCAQCQTGYSRFNQTTCEPCHCNNHSESCDPWTGTCLECSGNTEGPYCENCQDNFYHNNSGPHECHPCPCSLVASTGSCRIKPGDHAPSCDECKPGYTGRHCGQCADGYYSSNALCVRCQCNGNVDQARSPRVCKPETGECLDCLYHTAGFHCEKCREGYARRSEGGNCTKNEPTHEPEQRGLTSPAITIIPFTPSSTAAVSSPPSPTTAPTPFPAGSTDNSTSTLADVSWTQFNIIILTVIIILVVLLMGFVGAVYMYREYQNRKLNAPFWTIELKEDNISFSSYHDSIPNADVSGLLEDDGNEVAPNGQLTLATPMHNFKA